MGEKKDVFRFTVQFNAGDPGHRQTAAILNEQGRRKAQFLVNAVLHYINCPETPEIVAPVALNRQSVERLVREILADMRPEVTPVVKDDAPKDTPTAASSESIPFDAAAMLGEDGFQSLLSSLAAIQKS